MYSEIKTAAFVPYDDQILTVHRYCVDILLSLLVSIGLKPFAGNRASFTTRQGGVSDVVSLSISHEQIQPTSSVISFQTLNTVCLYVPISDPLEVTTVISLYIDIVLLFLIFRFCERRVETCRWKQSTPHFKVRVRKGCCIVGNLS